MEMRENKSFEMPSEINGSGGIIKFIEMRTVIVWGIWVVATFLLCLVYVGITTINFISKEEKDFSYAASEYGEDVDDVEEDNQGNLYDENELYLEQALTYIQEYRYNDVEMWDILEEAWNYEGDWNSFYWENENGETVIVVEYFVDDMNTFQFHLNSDCMEQQTLGKIYAEIEGKVMSYEESLDAIYGMYLVNRV